MFKSVITGFFSRNVHRLQPADYVLLGVVAAALLFVAFLILRWIFSLLFRKQRDASGNAALFSSGIFADRELLNLSRTERASLEEKVVHLNETFESLTRAYQGRKAEGAVLEDLCERSINYALSLRGVFMELIAATNAFLMFERMKSLLIVYSNAGIEQRFPEAPRLRELEAKLQAIKTNVIEPLHSASTLNVPDPDSFFAQFTVPGPRKHDVVIFNTEMDSLYALMKSYVERALKGRKKIALVAETTQIRNPRTY